MRSISKIAAAAALASIAAAGDAPAVENNPIGVTYSATLPNLRAGALTGAVKIAGAPDGEGVNIQISFYNLPNSGNLSYGIHTGRVSNGDCSGAGAILDPYGGTTGGDCFTDMASCQIGDLSDKHGAAQVLSGGSGTGYFVANYIDKYLSMKPGDEAFFGKGSFVIADSTGASVACANFVNPNAGLANSTGTASSSMVSSSATGAAHTKGSGGSGASSSSSSGFAVRTAAPVVGAGILGFAAMLI